MLLIGLDDTDTLESRGTGHLARAIAGELAGYARVLGVTRHQLLKDPRVPCTQKNSCAAIHLSPAFGTPVESVVDRVRERVLADFQPGSDPGLCVGNGVSREVIDFGWRAKRELLSQGEARALAEAHGLTLLGLGGTQDGVIGALAAVGLAASGDDGRYVLVGRSRELEGLLPVAALREAGIHAVQTAEGKPVTSGLVMADKLRPARRGGRAVAIVRWVDGYWQPLKLD